MQPAEAESPVAAGLEGTAEAVPSAIK